jgi:hypothetical protein
METALSNPTALYLYGIVAHPIELPRYSAVEDGTSIEVIAKDRLACVVSTVSARDYHSPATGRTAAEQLEWVTPRALRHHDIVCRLHQTTTVIPLKFGTLSGCADDVRDMLDRCAGPIAALLDRFHNKDEWGLTIRIDAGLVTERFERDDPALRELCEEERTLPEGRAYFVRKRRQRLAAALHDAEFAATARAVYARIGDHVDDCFIDSPHAPGATLLVDRARFDDLSAMLAQLEVEHHGNGLALELRGPWAPYTFANGRVDTRELTPGSGTDSRTPAHQQ